MNNKRIYLSNCNNFKVKKPVFAFTTRNFLKKELHSNYGEYEQVCPVKNGGPNTIKFVQKLRISIKKNHHPTSNKVFRFYNKSNDRWKERIRINNKKTIENRIKKGFQIGPNTKTVYDISDINTKGNIESVEHLIKFHRENNIINFALELRNYKGNDIKTTAKRRSSIVILPRNFEQQRLKLKTCNTNRNIRHQSTKPNILRAWNNCVNFANYSQTPLRIQSKFNDKFTDKNIAHFNMHFNWKNGKEQVEWQCKLRSYPTK